MNFVLTTSRDSAVPLLEKLLHWHSEETYIDAIDFIDDIVVFSGVVENDALWTHMLTLAESVK